MVRNRPRLVITCGRCGKPREGIRHVCVVDNSKRARHGALLKPSISFGKCPKCQKAIGNPLTHVCAPRPDFKKRKRAAEKRDRDRERAKARKKRQAGQHPFESCHDDQCKRPQCVAYRTGWHQGEAAGFESGFDAGLAACPRNHSSG